MSDERPLVVYVDDEASNRIVFEASLKAKFRIETFATGVEALERIGRGDVAVLVTDQRMPGISGNELLKLARERSPGTERVVITAYDDAGPILEALNSGLASRYVVKPWTRSDLEAALESCLHLYRLRREKVDLEHRLFEGERFVTLGAIAAGVFHDMSQPLQVLTASLGTLSSTDPEAMTDSRTAISQLLVMVRTAKQFLSPGKQVESTGDVLEAARAAVSLCKSRMHHDGVSFQADLPQTTTITAMPTAALVQVMVNLLVNATQAIRSGGPKAAIRFAVRIADGHAEVSVRDNGTGMAPEVLARAREPFFTTKPAGEGTGLGLFTCQRLASRHGGSLSIESTLGEGTTVSLRVPLS